MKFIDLLDSTDWFDGEITIAGMESEFSFVWDGDNTFTAYGKKKFAVILNGECTIDGNYIEVECDAEEELVDLFNASVAGYIPDSEYQKIFVEKPKKNEKLKVRITRCYLVELTDNEGNELKSEYTFVSREDAKAVGERLKQEYLNI